MRTGSSVSARAALLALLGAGAVLAQETVDTDAARAIIGSAKFPQPTAVSVTVVPPPSPLSVIGSAQFPQPRSITLAVSPPPTPYVVLGQANFPKPAPVVVSLVVDASKTASAAPPPPPRPVAAGTATADPAALAAVATANFPAPVPLSVTLVPPPSPLAAIASANFPAPQPLAATLVPPPSPLAAIASANFPSPQPLAVTLYAGEAVPAVTTFAGVAPGFTLTPPTYTVQIVQAIPRRGVDFFDRRNPAGQPGTLFAALGGAGGSASPCAPGPTSGGTFQSVIAGPYPRDLECHSLLLVSDPAGQGDVLAIGDFHMIFANPGASLSAAININSGATFATLTGPNTSTMSITGATTAPRGTAPAGTLMRIDGTAVNTGRFTNYTLTVCTAAGPVVYRRADGNCQ